MPASNRNTTVQRKLALIIRNDNYSRPDNRLNHSMNNADDLSSLLGTIEFSVRSESNLNKTDMHKLFNDFSKTIEDGDLVLFYFSGHGCGANGKNYLIPINDEGIETERDFQDFAIEVDGIINRLAGNKPSYASVFILDCCRPYVLKGTSGATAMIQCNGLHEMIAPSKTFIQFSCASDETAPDDFFFQHLRENIPKKNITVPNIFQRIADDVHQQRHGKQRPLSMNGLLELEDVYFNQVMSSLPNIAGDARWESNAQTIAGGHGPGPTLNRLHRPKGLHIDDKQTMLIADSSNHRIMKAIMNQRIAGKNIQDSKTHLLAAPSNVMNDMESNSFIICDYHNRRVLRWLHGSEIYAEVIIGNSECYAVAIDDEDALYVSDTERHEVRRYQAGEEFGTVVAGGNGQGRRLKQLNHPTYICIGDDQSLYVSDSWNDRVVRWGKGAKEGVIVAGGRGKGNDRKQLDCPAGVLVDRLGTVYVADAWNHRVMRWPNGERRGDLIAGDQYLPGSRADQLICPEGLAFDEDDNLYVADSNNHRIQRFAIQQP